MTDDGEDGWKGSSRGEAEETFTASTISDACGSTWGEDRRNVIVCGVGFFMLFFAFNTTQNFETTINEDIGYYSLALIYFMFSTSNVFSSRVVLALGDSRSLVLSSMTYTLFIVSNVYPEPYVVLPASALLGFGAAVLWTAQGAVIAKNSTKETLGRHNGMTKIYTSAQFWSMFMCNAVFGNMFAALILPHVEGSEYILFVLLSFFAGGGNLLFLFIRPAPVHTPQPTSVEVELAVELDAVLDEREGTAAHSLAQDDGGKPAAGVWATVALFRDPRMLLLATIMIYSGTSQSFIYGKFPPLAGKELLGWVMAVFGASGVTSAVTGGFVSDRLGRRVVLLTGLLVHTSAYVVLFSYLYFGYNGVWVLFTVAIALGIGDACWNTQVNAVVAHFNEADPEPAFAYFKLLQATSSACAFVYGKYLLPMYFIVLLLGLMWSGCTLLVALHYTVASIERSPDAASTTRS